MDHPTVSHKRNASEVQSNAFAASENGDSVPSAAPTIASFPSSFMWEQQKASKRPRTTGEYREPHHGTSLDDDVDGDDEDNRQDDDDLNSLKVFTDKSSNHQPRSDFDSTSSLGEDDSETRSETREKHPRRSKVQSRWIFRRNSSLDSISSSVITELSASEVADALGGGDGGAAGLTISSSRRRRNSGGLNNLSRKQPPMDNLLRNMEQWSLSHIRALRRNNVLEGGEASGGSSADDRMNRRRAVEMARRDVMRALRRGSLASVSTNGDADSNSNSNGNSNNNNPDQNDDSEMITTVNTSASSKRRSSATSLNSAKTV